MKYRNGFNRLNPVLLSPLQDPDSFHSNFDISMFTLTLSPVSKGGYCRAKRN